MRASKFKSFLSWSHSVVLDSIDVLSMNFHEGTISEAILFFFAKILNFFQPLTIPTFQWGKRTKKEEQAIYCFHLHLENPNIKGTG